MGDPAPAFEAQTLAGTNVRGASLRGQITVVEFFASWCEPCKESLAEVLALRESVGAHFGLSGEGRQPPGTSVARFVRNKGD